MNAGIVETLLATTIDLNNIPFVGVQIVNLTTITTKEPNDTLDPFQP